MPRPLCPSLAVVQSPGPWEELFHWSWGRASKGGQVARTLCRSLHGRPVAATVGKPRVATALAGDVAADFNHADFVPEG